MKDHLENNRPRLTDAERRYVWERVREGRRPWSLGGTWRLWSPAAAGALAVVILAFVLIDKTPPWRPSPPADTSAQAPAMTGKARDRSVDLVIASDSTSGEVPAATRPQTFAQQPESERSTQAADRSQKNRPAGGGDPAVGESVQREGALLAPASPALESKQEGGAPPSNLTLAAPKPEESGEAVASSVPPAGAADLSAQVQGAESQPVPSNARAADEGSKDQPYAMSDVDATGSRPIIGRDVTRSEILRDKRSDAASPRLEAGDGAPRSAPGDNTERAESGDTPRAEFHADDEGADPVRFDAMFFRDYGANPLMLADRDRLSTFAVDVDGGAYTLARSYIERGALPDRAAPRVEEFVNYFSGGYPEFDDADFRIFVDGAPSPFGDGFHLVRVGIKARTIAEDERRPSRLTFVIDVSGSMEREDRLGLVQRALRLLVDELEERDRVGIVVYGSRGRVLLESVSVAQRERILEAIDSLAPDGSTNAEEGLLLGYELAQRSFDPDANNRIVLCSDGVANVGRTGPEAILERARSEADRGIYLTTVGFGMGNYNDVLMEQLADGGDGAYYYVDDLEEARRVFVERLTGTLQVVARDAKVQVEFDPERVVAYRLLGFENRDVADQDFRNDRVDAGEIGSGHEVTALYEVRFHDEVEVGRARGEFATVRFRYELPPVGKRGVWTTPFGGAGRDDAFGRTRSPVDRDRAVREIAREVEFTDLQRSFEEASPRLHLAATVAEFAEILRQSYWAKENRLLDLVPLARRVASELRGDGEVANFARLVEKAASIEERLSRDEIVERERIRERQRPMPPYFP